jgi:mannose-1-phosphate guanylyltransferase/mannose-6-phosphate isomerase
LPSPEGDARRAPVRDNGLQRQKFVQRYARVLASRETIMQRRLAETLSASSGGEAEEGRLRSVVPVILSGGSGTRLWPLSRAQHPKQFLELVEENTTLLGATVRRTMGAALFAAPIVVCNNQHRFLVADELSRAKVEACAIVLEPVGRGTAAAAAVAALIALRSDPEAILAVMPSDHVVRDEARFMTALARAAALAATGKLVLFGIKPTHAHTGYGYISRGDPLDAVGDAFAVEGFYEKPERAQAEAFLAGGHHYWNAGIFVLHARTFLDELDRLAADVLSAATAALDGAEADLQFLRLDRVALEAAPSISIDRAVMEKTGAAAMLALDVGWADVGAWSSLWQIAAHDESGNATRGDCLLRDTTDCYVHSERTLVATIGVKDLVIVDTPDALLVAEKSRAEDVASLVEALKRTNRSEHAQHLRTHRPWGYFETLNAGPRFQVKLLHVKPQGRLSMQMHFHRSEHWVVVRGTAKVTIGEREMLVQENESAYITSTHWHRLENPGRVPLEIIEVQIGSYLGEDDIVRRDDIYNRALDETA